MSSAGEDVFDVEAMAFMEEELRRGAVQAEVVSLDEDGNPFVQLYIISGNTVRPHNDAKFHERTFRPFCR